MKRAIHFIIAAVVLYGIGELTNYKWGAGAGVFCLLYSLWTWEDGFRQGRRTCRR